MPDVARSRPSRRRLRLRLAATLSASGLASALALAQGTPAPSPGTPVSGAQLRSWLDQKFSYAGVHLPSGCALMNTGEASRRVLFLSCPNGWSEMLRGTARVEGDTWCTSFQVPNTPPGEDCVTWHALGGGRYEQRKGARPEASVVLIAPPALAAP